MWICWNAYGISNILFFLDLSANYKIFFWHDLWNDAGNWQRIFYYWKYLILKCYDEYDWKYWSCYTLHLIDFDTTWLCILFLNWNMKHDLWKNFNLRWFELSAWQCRGSRQWRLICWQLISLEDLYHQQTNDMSPANQRQTTSRPAITKDFAARWFAACYKMTCSLP